MALQRLATNFTENSSLEREAEKCLKPLGSMSNKVDVEHALIC